MTTTNCSSQLQTSETHASCRIQFILQVYYSNTAKLGHFIQLMISTHMLILIHVSNPWPLCSVEINIYDEPTPRCCKSPWNDPSVKLWSKWSCIHYPFGVNVIPLCLVERNRIISSLWPQTNVFGTLQHQRIANASSAVSKTPNPCELHTIWRTSSLQCR
jgi:hypothetical protein